MELMNLKTNKKLDYLIKESKIKTLKSMQLLAEVSTDLKKQAEELINFLDNGCGCWKCKYYSVFSCKKYAEINKKWLNLCKIEEVYHTKAQEEFDEFCGKTRITSK